VNQAAELVRRKGRVVPVGDVGLALERGPLYQREADLLIGADGLRSATRTIIDPDAPAPEVEALGDEGRLEGVWFDAMQEGVRFDDESFWPVSMRREPAGVHRLLTLQTTGG
jgi:2-polyprenyl-6-methoxyphenol hydroxylase-like FAD-dependent oxidoreductase